MVFGSMKMKLLTSAMVIVFQRKDQMTPTETNPSMFQDGEILKIRHSELMDGTILSNAGNMMSTTYSH